LTRGRHQSVALVGGTPNASRSRADDARMLLVRDLFETPKDGDFGLESLPGTRR
jgi:hypothetical protein